MKKNLFILIVFLFLFLIKTQAQKPITFKHNLFGYLNKTYALSFEAKTTDRTSLQFTALYSLRNLDPKGEVGLEFQYRNYFLKSQSAPKGFYFAPAIGMYVFEKYYKKYSYFGFGIAAGYQHVFNNGITLDGGLNPQFLVSTSGVEFTRPVILNVNISVGYTFFYKAIPKTIN